MLIACHVEAAWNLYDERLSKSPIKKQSDSHVDRWNKEECFIKGSLDEEIWNYESLLTSQI